jgi:hypothetical protein
MGRPDDDDDDDRRTRALAGVAVILLLLVVGLFMTQKLKAVSDLEDCLMSGRTNCAPIDPATLDR